MRHLLYQHICPIYQLLCVFSASTQDSLGITKLNKIKCCLSYSPETGGPKKYKFTEENSPHEHSLLFPYSNTVKECFDVIAELQIEPNEKPLI